MSLANFYERWRTLTDLLMILGEMLSPSFAYKFLSFDIYLANIENLNILFL